MKQIRLWEAHGSSAYQEISRILWKLKSPPLDSIVNQLSSVHNLAAYLFKSILILFFHLLLNPSRGLFPSGFTIKILYAFLSSSLCLLLSPPASSSTIYH